MATFRYYKYLPMASPRQWAVAGVLLFAASMVAMQWEFFEDREIIGSMHDKTYLYQGFYTAQENQPKKETFKRIE